MSKLNSLGTTRNLSAKYSEIKRNLNNTKLTPRLNLNDSGSLINDNGRVKYDLFNYSLISSKEHLVEMSNWHLPPKYVELFDRTNDNFKELLIKCKKIKLKFSF